MKSEKHNNNTGNEEWLKVG